MFRISGLRRIFRFPWRTRGQIEHEVDAELRFHLDRRTEELIDQGMTPEAARREAVRQFGDLAHTKQYCRALGGRTELKVRRTMRMDELRQDVRYGVRMLTRSPGFTTVAVLSLALGIGATTTIFSVLNAAVLRPLPFPQPDRLVAIRVFDPERGRERNPTASTFVAWREQNQTFEEMAMGGDGAAGGAVLPLSWAGGTERVGRLVVGPHLFPLLGVQPVLGRGFVTEDFRESPISGSAVVISFGLWQQLFGGDPAALGQELTIGAETGTKTIVGVMPPDFWVSPQSSTVHVWVADDYTQASLTERQNAGRVEVWGRLKGGVSVEQAQADLQTISRGLEMDAATEDTPWHVQVEPLAQGLSVRYAGTLYVLLGAVAVCAPDRLPQRGHAVVGPGGGSENRNCPPAWRWGPAGCAWCGNCAPKACCCPCWAACSASAWPSPGSSCSSPWRRTGIRRPTRSRSTAWSWGSRWGSRS